MLQNLIHKYLVKIWTTALLILVLPSSLAAQVKNFGSEAVSMDVPLTDISGSVIVSSTDSLQTALGRVTGGSLILEPGVYKGNFLLERQVNIVCKRGAVLDGEGKGDVFRVTASNVSIRGCTIQNWGDDLTAMDAGIVVKKTADNVVIEDNKLHGITFGIFLDASPNTKVINNEIRGVAQVRSQDRGNGIHLYAATGADVAFNIVSETRDGIYIDTSNKNTIRNNEFHHLRYGVHYMYSYSNTVSNNYTHNTRTGYALMQSKYLVVTNNRSENDENYGILINYITNSTISGNTVHRATSGATLAGGGAVQGAEGKSLFIYNSLYNTITNNTLAESDLGIHITAGSEDNIIAGNNFIGNQQQVKYVSNVTQEWSKDGTGNYWSDYLGWDRNNNGTGDIPYEPNDGIDKLLWKYPSAKVLMNSPAIETLRWIQREFPVLKSPGVKDSYPLMRPSKPLISQVPESAQ